MPASKLAGPGIPGPRVPVPAALAAALGGVHILSLRALLLRALLLPAEHASLQQTEDPAAGAQPLASEGVRWREGQGDTRGRALWMRASEATERGNAGSGRDRPPRRPDHETLTGRCTPGRGGGTERCAGTCTRLLTRKAAQSVTLPLRLTRHFCSLSPRCDEADQD